MIKKGDKVYHWQKIDRVGIVEQIITESNNLMTVGGTTTSKVYYKIRYEDDSIEVYRSGDVLKHFD